MLGFLGANSVMPLNFFTFILSPETGVLTWTHQVRVIVSLAYTAFMHTSFSLASY